MYGSFTKTNFFKVKNPEAFRKFMESVYGESEITVLSIEHNGEQLFKLSCAGSILGCIRKLLVPYTCAGKEIFSYTDFANGLKRHLAEGQAALLIEGRTDGETELAHDFDIISAHDAKCAETLSEALAKGSKMLGKPWTPIMSDAQLAAI